MISIFAPTGITEITPESDLVGALLDAIAADQQGPLRDGDIVVVTSKVVSKHEGRTVPVDQRLAAITSESVRTVARRGMTRIVQTHHGITLAGAGIDNSNIAPEHLLLLPKDPDASATAIRRTVFERSGVRIGVVISDTAGRAWRIGQTDMAIGTSGVRVIEAYAGRKDPYGNELHVTAVAIADELASAADLAKSKLGGRPVAVIRGLAEHVLDPSTPPGSPDALSDSSSQLLRESSQDLFRHGTREAVLAAVLAATEQSERFEELVDLDTAEEIVAAIVEHTILSPEQASIIGAVLGSAF